MKTNQKIIIKNIKAFNGLTGTILEKLKFRYSNETNDHLENGFMATFETSKFDCYLIRLDKPIICERNGISYGEELMVFPAYCLKSFKE